MTNTPAGQDPSHPIEKGDSATVALANAAGREEFSRSLALLRFEGKDGPVFFVMDHGRYHPFGTPDTDEKNQHHQRYFFEEHSCPTNWLKECVMVIKDGDCDPHGFLSFVRAVDVPEDFDTGEDDKVAALFPEAFGEGITIDGVSTEVLAIESPNHD
jgi:hypothetical protein